jgi:hypothetical protein
MVKVRDIILWEKRKSIILSEGSQVSPAHPSDKSCVKVKALERLEAVSADRDCGIVI